LAELVSHTVPANKETNKRHAKASGAKPNPGALRIGAVNAAFEQEADRVADKIVDRGAKPKLEWSLSRTSISGRVQRKCSCGGSGECEECKKQSVQRKATGSAEPDQAPPIVHSGQKLLAHELAHVVQQQQAPLGVLQRAPAPKPAAGWWEEKGIGSKPQAKFWGDVRLFFPKDARKFAGARLDNTPNIDCDDTGIVSIGKGYWDQADAMKRKAAILPLITKRDGKRYDDARIDDEDLTNDQIIAKLKALTGPGIQAYVAQLTARSSYINNSQVIAYLNGDDNEKTRIAGLENEKLLDWKFAADRLTDADFRDEKVNTRLRGLSTAQKTAKAEKAREFATQTGEETSKLQSFLQLQTTTSTPMPADASVSAAGGFTMNRPNVDVTVLPDQSGGKANETGPESNFPKGQFNFNIDKATGKITEFFKMDGKKKVPVIMPPKLQLTIQTQFKDITKADATSAYGKGTTAQDIAWGARTLRFHEGSHGKVDLEVIRSTNVPSLAIGTVTPADIRVITDMFNRLNAQSCQLVDQVGRHKMRTCKRQRAKSAGS
jgi:uncharacterized protein DUF4157